MSIPVELVGGPFDGFRREFAAPLKWAYEFTKKATTGSGFLDAEFPMKFLYQQRLNERGHLSHTSDGHVILEYASTSR